MIRRLVAAIWNGSIETAGFVFGHGVRVGVKRGWLYFPFVSESLSRLPFSIGWKLRRSIYARILPEIGKDAVLHFGVTLEDERTRIGNDVWISRGCYIDYSQIGDSVLIGPHALLLSGGRQHRTDRLDIPIKQQGNFPKEPLIVGKGAWIGANATVMAEVGEDSIVGAGAVVTKPVPARAIVAGNPARVIRIRDEQDCNEKSAARVAEFPARGNEYRSAS